MIHSHHIFRFPCILVIISGVATAAGEALPKAPRSVQLLIDALFTDRFYEKIRG